MKTENLFLLRQLCIEYEVDMSFFTQLNEYGLIEISVVESDHYIHEDKISDLERMIRMNQELDINPEGIDAIFHLLSRIEMLQNELMVLKNRLSLYENEEK